MSDSRKPEPNHRAYYRYVSDLTEEMRPTLPGPHPPRRWDRARIKRIAGIVILSVCFLIALAYACDYLLARYRVARGRALGTIEVGHLNAIPQKSGKTEFTDLTVEPQPCLRSLFPHFGYSPCWYLRRHADQRTNF